MSDTARPPADGGLTAALVAAGLAVRREALPPAAARVARDCLVDWIGCALAARDEPVGRIVVEAARAEGGRAQATIVGQGWQTTPLEAALANGTLAHALDYDDVNLAVPGHLSAAILPAVLALAEARDTTAADALTAFVAGYEFACRVGLLTEPAHYANGFHATATIGCLGAAMACARLLALPPVPACHAIGLAATQAAGLKIMFGSMAKPLHAGLAAQAGLRSALLAARGLTSRTDALECPQGFAAVHGADFHPQRARAMPTGDWHVFANLFKFHASCYSTHAAIEAVARLREVHALAPESVASIRIVAGSGCSICNIQQPKDALEAKFSLRASAAFALLGLDTSALATWERVGEPAVAAVIERVAVELVPAMGLSDATVTVSRRDGAPLTLAHDCGEPIADKAVQSARIAAKFRAIVDGTIDAASADRLLAALDGLVGPGGFDGESRLVPLMHLCRVG